MAFFDKLNDLAKSVKDAANDAVETTRIKSRISSEKRAVDEACRKIGEYYYAKRAGDMGPVDDDILEYCIEIDEHMRVISELEAELERERAAKEAAEQAFVQCPSCGAKNGKQAKFCQECGNKLQADPPPEVPANCPNCGQENPPGTRFCGGCDSRRNKRLRSVWLRLADVVRHYVSRMFLFRSCLYILVCRSVENPSCAADVLPVFTASYRHHSRLRYGRRALYSMADPRRRDDIIRRMDSKSSGARLRQFPRKMKNTAPTMQRAA